MQPFNPIGCGDAGIAIVRPTPIATCKRQLTDSVFIALTVTFAKMPPRRSQQPGNNDECVEEPAEKSVVEVPAERSVVDFDSTDAIQRALSQFSVDEDSDWKLQNYDVKTTITDPNKIDEEAFRLSVLKSYNVLNTQKELEFEFITKECQELFRCPIAVVSLVDMGRQWFKSIAGLPAESTPRCVSFCAHVVKKATESVMVVPDASLDPRFKENPLVAGGPQIRFYAGAPLTTPEGAKIGSLCVIDTKPHPEGLSRAEQEKLKDLAQEVVLQLISRT